jgi:MarR family transcriptional regulator, multiple antibiotic resistance protein MarR
MVRKTASASAESPLPAIGQADEPLYTAENWTMDESLGYLLHQVRGRLVAAIDTELEPLDITWAQWGTLLKIANGHARTASELSRNMAGDTGSVTRMLDRLEQKGLIRRERSSADRRIVQLSLTEAGQRLYPQLPPIAVKVLNQHLRGFSRDELEMMKDFLRRMLANSDCR